MMNRQLRRAQDKKDRLKEREKERAREDRRAKITRRRERRRANAAAAAAGKTQPATPQTRKTQPGRFSAVFTFATAMFIILQALVPVREADGFGFAFVVELLYYLLFGYFIATWLMRRGTARAFEVGAGIGVGLALLLQIATAILGTGPDLELLAFAVPAAVAGAWAGRFVYLRAP